MSLSMLPEPLSKARAPRRSHRRPQADCTVRAAALDDVESLCELEQRGFDSDRLSERHFRYMLTKANAETLVAEKDGVIVGYALVLYNTGTPMARLYSLTTGPGFRREGIGRTLLAAAERDARKKGCISLRLEVRRDNYSARRFYEHTGYKPFGVVEDYYEDHMDALRFEKHLVRPSHRDVLRVPYYRQSLEFTCGPASLLMAMSALDRSVKPTRRHELRLWREATTIFMTSGHGGCDPCGLALAAYRRGYDVEVYIKARNVMFVDSVRSQAKKEVIRLVIEDFHEQIRNLPIRLEYRSLGSAALQRKFTEGGILLVLISSYRLYKEKFPHWVVVTGFDDNFIYVHDPYVVESTGETMTDRANMPIPRKVFEKMARYGRTGQQAVLIVKMRKRERRGESAEPA